MTASMRILDVPEHLRDLANEVFRVELIDEDPRRATLLRRRLRRRLRDLLEREPQNVRAWIMLADHYRTRPTMIRTYQRALMADPKNPEAHAELGCLLAPTNAKAARRHPQTAVRFCRGYPIEDEVLAIVIRTARDPRCADIEEKAVGIALRRFPDLRELKPRLRLSKEDSG